MDIDGVNPVSEWLALFQPLEDLPWTPQRSQEIENRRAHMTDVLIFDVLLIRGGIRQPAIYYPPSDEISLRHLLEAIENSTYDSLKKDCLVYILLKWYQDGRELRFQEERCIPPQFVALGDAYWHLDTGIHVAKAVSILSDARLNRDYASKILQALSLSENPYPLIVKYVRTAKPQLTEPDDINLYTIALAEASLWQAWQYQRTFLENSDIRRRLINKILRWCLSPKPRPQPLTDLITIPLPDYEQTLVHEYALHPPSDLPPASVAIIQDLVCLRLVQSGQHIDAIKLDRQFSASSHGASGDALKAVQERRQMLDEVALTMPDAEKRLLEAELQSSSQGVSTVLPVKPQHSNGRVPMADLSMSWEEIQLPRTSVNRTGGRSTNTTIPFISRDSPASSVRHTPTDFDNRKPLNGAAGVTTPRDLFAPPISKASFQPSAPTINFTPTLSTSQGTSQNGPRVGSTGLKFASTKPSTATSLFDKAGSANQTPNAFYKPPATSGVKHVLPVDTHPVQMPTPLQNGEDHADDVSMASDNEFISPEANIDTALSPSDDDGKAELSFSVFGSATQQPQPPVRRPVKQANRNNVPPGAFHRDDDDESDVEPPPRRNANHRPRARTPETPRNTHTRLQEIDLKQSIPGSLMDEDDEEDEDEVPPLPPSPQSRRPVRKSRASTTTSKTLDRMEKETPVRRSSRLSTASSAASLSPEPSSPPKPAKTRKSARTSGAAATATRSSTRKKR
ncbi:nuclear pore complex assembly-domain-containing protein [Hygrophoropsis aurantiaca]|uniref:Nuclear pore complex assembly-domain-containing protein n=1 Tax=Hygrophoropsis aurantiaca TaxID=72124 RepID=A0ACB8AAZ5_9AGAM|nr:nuclear pore complex assembly-domain-containing protein [Hygrophoropsis aurantiaca]